MPNGVNKIKNNVSHIPIPPDVGTQIWYEKRLYEQTTLKLTIWYKITQKQFINEKDESVLFDLRKFLESQVLQNRGKIIIIQFAKPFLEKHRSRALLLRAPNLNIILHARSLLSWCEHELIVWIQLFTFELIKSKYSSHLRTTN